MPIIHELFGYPLTDNSSTAKSSRRNAQCPFTGGLCDGGGNRDMAKISLRNDASLRSHFDGVGTDVACGICSIQQAQGQEWVICPRRILCFGNGELQAAAADRTLRISGWEPPQRLAVWREVRVNATGDNGQKFNYAFDYIIRRLNSKSNPDGEPLVVEIMTCSTSGGNKAKGTDIQSAFCKAVRGEEHKSPGVNHRQVWARMASQLIVKSEAGIQWGGRTAWVIQDTLADYIIRSTGLRLSEMRSQNPGEVNLLAFRYDKKESSPRALSDAELYSGPISSNGNDAPCFLDIIRAPFVPQFDALEQVLANREFQIWNWE